jgi:hypothetical protein
MEMPYVWLRHQTGPGVKTPEASVARVLGINWFRRSTDSRGWKGQATLAHRTGGLVRLPTLR